MVNEVTTGLGKTGKLFGYQHYNIKPDIIAMGKALGNGYPISGVVMSKNIASLVEGKKFKYAQSHQNNPLGCAIANKVIDIFISDDMVFASIVKGEFLLKSLEKINSPLVKDIRGRGLMCAIKLNYDGLTEIIFDRMFDKGFAIGTTPKANVLRFSPAATISNKNITKMTIELERTLDELLQEL